ncbi:MAG: hypothetical protein QNJ94_17090 [Alphaproteobacteria bacterium]|nr:hypothetical protein [Alphaproteobacteria bacterium]
MLTANQERVLGLFREAARQGRAAPSNAEIMDRLGLTRGQASGVVFKLRRRGLIPDRACRRPAPRETRARAVVTESERAADLLQRLAGDRRRLRRLLRKIQASWLGAREEHRITITRRFETGVRHRTCQWIAGPVPSRASLGRRPDPAEIEAGKCGQPVQTGRPYCPAHQSRAARPVPVQVALRAADRLVEQISRSW